MPNSQKIIAIKSVFKIVKLYSIPMAAKTLSFFSFFIGFCLIWPRWHNLLSQPCCIDLLTIYPTFFVSLLSLTVSKTKKKEFEVYFLKLQAIRGGLFTQGRTLIVLWQFNINCFYSFLTVSFRYDYLFWHLYFLFCFHLYSRSLMFELPQNTWLVPTITHSPSFFFCVYCESIH